MGTSTNGLFAYGYDLGGPENEWAGLLGSDGEEIDPDELPAWYDPDDDDAFDEQAISHLLRATGFLVVPWDQRADWPADQSQDYHRTRREAEKALGIEFETHCSGDYPMYLLVAWHDTARRGQAEPIDLDKLLIRRTDEVWDTKLAWAVETLQLRPRADKPQWLLASWWSW